MANKGYFIITDISGYTEYLTDSELDHAHDILQSLFESQIARVKFPLKISGFRGDAILIYTSESCFINPQSFLETLENLYIAFSVTLQQMQINTNCQCKACRNINKLDLKMCIHYGEYILQKLGDREELLGPDVIVPHRMLKNHVIEHTGIKAYALFSKAAAEALDLHRLCEPLVSYMETYDHIGEVSMFIHDLRSAWEREQARKNHLVDPETAWFKIELDIPFPPSLVWDYITVPEYEAPILGLDSVKRIDTLGGRTGNETRFHCSHSSGDFFNRVVDWKPFDYYTVFQTGVAGLEYYRTIRLIPIGSGTAIRIHFSEPEGGAPQEIRDVLYSVARQGYERIPAAIQNDIDAGKRIIHQAQEQ